MMEEGESQELNTQDKPISKFKYRKSSGFSGFRGEAFEFKTCALLLARVLKLKYKFKMASNIRGYGKFDDIIFSCDTGKDKFCLFMQLKNKSKDKIKLDNLLREKHDFSLREYYDSYMEIQEKFQTHRNIPFDVEFNNCLFVLYTNADVEQSLRGELKDENVPLDIVKAGGCVLQLTEDKNKQVYEALGVLPKFRDFLSKFFIMYNQPNDDRFDSFVSLEIQECLNIPFSMEKTALESFFKEVTEWWKKESSSTYLSECTKDNPLQKTMNHVAALKLSNLMEECNLGIKKLELKFCDNALEDLEVVICKNKITMILAAYNVEISVCKVYQIFHKTDKFLIMKLQNLEQQKSEVLSAWKNEIFDVLIIYNVSSSSKLDTICSEIYNICENSKNVTLKVIFITEIRNSKEIKIIKSSFGRQLTLGHDDIDFSQFETETKNKLLEKKITFQGHEVPLSNCTQSLDWLEGESLSYLLEEKPRIGSPLPDPVEYYIPRTMESYRIMNSNILKETGIIFCLYGGQQSEFSKFVPHSQNICPFKERTQNSFHKFVWIDDIQEFQTVCKENKMPVLWLKEINQKLILTQSCRATQIVDKYLNEDDQISWKTETLLEGDEKIIVVTAEPGMGKSTLLTYLSKQTKQNYPHLWILRININDYTDILSKFKDSDILEDNVIELLEKAVNAENVFVKEFLLHSYKAGNMVVLVDAIDEISPYYSEVVFQILKILCNSRVMKIWVTSRAFLKSNLEEISGVKSYRIIPFDKNDQKHFLRKFWESRTDKLNETTFNSCIEHIFKLVDECLDYNNNNFMRIPLHILLLAEVFEDILKHANPENKLENLNILQFYDKFIDKKWTVYNEEKKKINLTNVQLMNDDMELKEKFIENNKLVALLTLFSSDQLKLINDIDVKKAEKYLNKIKYVDDKTGLIISVNNERAQFLHRTVAEYFAAKWLFDHRDKIGQFLKEYCFKPEYTITRRMLDYQLTEGFPLHMSILNGNLEENIELLEEEGSVNKQDLEGRTALHLAVMYRLPTEAKILLEHGADENIKDSLLGQSSVDYTCYMYHLDMKPGQISKNLNSPSSEVMIEILQARPETRNLFLSVIIPNSANYLYDGRVEKLCEMMEYYIIKGENLSGKILCNVTSFYQNIITNTEWVELLYSQAADHTDNKFLDKNIPESGRFGYLEFIKYVEEDNNLNLMNLPTIPLVLHFPVTNNENEGKELQRNRICVYEVERKDGQKLFKVVDYCNSEYGKLLKFMNKASNLKSSLEVAVMTENVKLAQLLLESGVPVNATTNEDPLCIAIKMNHFELCELLLKYISVKDLYFPFTVAIQFGQLDIVKLLLAKLTNKKITRTFSITEGREPIQVKKFLLEDLVRTDPQIFKLCVAAECGYLEMVELLLKLGADVNEVDEYYGTPLIAAAQGGQVEVVRFLLSKGAHVEAKDKVGKTALHASACSFPTKNCSSLNTICRHIQICSFLIKNGADVNVTNNKDTNITPLHCAITYNHVDVVHCLLKANAKLTTENINCQPPLYVAIKHGNFEITKLLLSKFDFTDPLLEYNHTPLCAAISAPFVNLKTIDMLLERGHYVNYLCKEKCTPIFSATVAGVFQLVELMVDRGAKVNIAHDTIGWSPLHVAVCLPSSDVAILLLENGASVNMKDKHGRTPLHFAVINPNFAISLLLNSKNKKSLMVADENGWTSLFFAAKYGLAHRLPGISHGMRKVDKEGRTALFASALNGHVEDVQFLVNNKGGVNVKDKHGLRPLHVAACGGHLEIVKILLNAGAYANETDNFNFMPFHYAQWNNHKEVVELLRTNLPETAIVNKKLTGIVKEINEWNNRFECELWNEVMSSDQAVLRRHFIDNLDQILRIKIKQKTIQRMFTSISL